MAEARVDRSEGFGGSQAIGAGHPPVIIRCRASVLDEDVVVDCIVAFLGGSRLGCRLRSVPIRWTKRRIGSGRIILGSGDDGATSK